MTSPVSGAKAARVALAGLVLATAATLTVATSPQGDPETRDAARSSLVETSEVRLLLIDVEVRDRDGRPMPGLEPGAFEITLDGRGWPVYSVDDLCDCDPGPPAPTEASRVPVATHENRPGSVEAPEPAETGGACSPEPARGGREPVRFVLYLDFGQFRQFGRDLALRAARRWLGEGFRSGDEAMIVAWSWDRGLSVLTEFTGDAAVLLQTLEEDEHDVDWVDPFPVLRESRQDSCFAECRSNCTPLPDEVCCSRRCRDVAFDEYVHSRRSLDALRRMLVRLQGVNGRKELLYFHENGNLFPSRIYEVSTRRIPGQLSLLEEVGAEASAARTTIHGIYTGPGIGPSEGGQAVNLSANLAQFTGGSYNRGESDLSRMLDGVGRDCACIYRIALEPPEDSRGRIHRVRVFVGARAMKPTWRVRMLTPLDRWLRGAQDVLRDPSGARALPVTASVLPVRARAGRWDVVVQVVVDLAALDVLPVHGASRGRWEVGALLTRNDGADTWEMLGLSTVDADDEAGRELLSVHRRLFRDLKPGTYRLAAFARDATANVFGGSEAELELPRPRSAAIVGPLLLWPSRRHVVVPLPLWTRRSAASEDPAERAGVRAGPVPYGAGPSAAGERLTALTLVCGRNAAKGSDDVLRFVSGGGAALYRFPRARLEDAGTCRRVTDEIETWRLASGEYSYHVRLRAGEVEVEEAAARFVVDRGEAPEPAADNRPPPSEPDPD